MNNTIEKLQYLIVSSQKTINNPSIPISKSLGIQQNHKGKWIYTQGAFIGTAVIVGSSSLAKIGLTVGVIAAGAGAASTIPVAGWIVAGAIVVGSGGYYIWKCKKNKREQVEKERLYQEIIKKQQAAINRQQDIIRQLEEKLGQADNNNKKIQEEILTLRQQIKNLQELINLLAEQLKEFKKKK